MPNWVRTSLLPGNVTDSPITSSDSTVVAGDFPAAFLLVAVIAASSALVFALLPKEAGASLASRARAVGVPPEPASAPQG